MNMSIAAPASLRSFKNGYIEAFILFNTAKVIELKNGIQSTQKFGVRIFFFFFLRFYLIENTIKL